MGFAHVSSVGRHTEGKLPRTVNTDAPQRAAIFERDGSNIAVMLLSLLMLILVGVAGYFLLQSQDSVAAKGKVVAGSAVRSQHGEAMAIRATVERQTK